MSVEKMKKLLRWANSRLEKAKSLQERIQILRHCSKKGLSLPVAATLYLAEIGTKEKKKTPEGV